MLNVIESDVENIMYKDDYSEIIRSSERWMEQFLGQWQRKFNFNKWMKSTDVVMIVGIYHNRKRGDGQRYKDIDVVTINSGRKKGE